MNTDYSQPAFPLHIPPPCQGSETVMGMTLLDHFAGQAMAAYLNHPDGAMRSMTNAVHNSYLIAAAMMEERKKYITS